MNVRSGIAEPILIAAGGPKFGAKNDVWGLNFPGSLDPINLNHPKHERTNSSHHCMPPLKIFRKEFIKKLPTKLIGHASCHGNTTGC